MIRPITLLKLLAMVTIIAGSLGLLWHQDRSLGMWGGHNYFNSDFGLPKTPTWLNIGLNGWFPMAVLTVYWVFHTVPSIAVSYLISSILCIVALLCIPFIQNKKVRLAIGVSMLLLFAYEYVVLEISGELPDASTTTAMIMNWRFGLEGTVFAYTKEIVSRTVSQSQS